MASVVDDVSFDGPGRPGKYPWESWLNGQTWELVQGEDFECHSDSMQSAVYAAARRRGLSVSIRTNDSGMFVRARVKESVEQGA